MHWKWYEQRITEFFKKVRGAVVKPNVLENGQDTHTKRQIDILIQVPLKIDLGNGFNIDIPVKIIVDCKDRKRPVDVTVVDEVAGLKDDVRAHLGVIVTPTGISEAAKERAKATGIRPLVVTGDLIAMTHPFSDYTDCLLCEYNGDEEYSQPEVFWHGVEGRCDWCNGIHFRCPDCGAIFAVTEGEYGKALKCPENCGAVFYVDYSHHKDEPHEIIEVFISLDAELITKAYAKTSKRLTPNEVSRLVDKTRWQHWGEASPTIGVTESGNMEYRDDDNLYLTSQGEKWAKIIMQADYPICY